MLERLLSKATNWASQHFEDPALPGDLTVDDLDAKIAELDHKREEQRQTLDQFSEEYRSVARKAGSVDPDRLRYIREELKLFILAYAEARRAYAKTMTGLNVLRRWRLAASSEEESARPDVELDHVSTAPPKPPTIALEKLKALRERVLEGPAGSGGSVATADEGFEVERLVDAVVTAARNDEPLPGLHELLANDAEDDVPLKQEDCQDGSSAGDATSIE